MTVVLRHEYSAREFNRDPGAVSRAARQFGRVRITLRGKPSLMVLDVAQYPEFAQPGGLSVLDSLSNDWDWDDSVVGEPPRASIGLRTLDES